MSEPLTIALDAMGGDNAPGIVIKGANIARRRFPDVHFLVFGDENKIQTLLKKMPALIESCTIVHTDKVITNEAKPSLAVRQGKPPFGAALNAIRLFRQEIIAVDAPQFLQGHTLPLDSMTFRDSALRPGETATFDFVITDTTPVALFYLVQRPNRPLSHLDTPRATGARL